MANGDDEEKKIVKVIRLCDKNAKVNGVQLRCGLSKAISLITRKKEKKKEK